MTDFAQTLRDFINESLKLWNAPGVAVGVVQGEQILLCDGFGWRDVEHQQPVTSNTLFAIGSASKAFTTFDLGLLVDEGKLDWDKPVRDFMPAFQLNDPVASERLTPRDIVSHRVGLPRHDLMWYNTPRSRQEIFSRLRYLEPNKDIRQTFQYNNLMFLTAGVLIQHLSGLTWEDFTRRRVFEPLGMARSNFSVTTSQQSDDFALPYQEKQDQREGMPFRNIDSVGPAGSINSCVADMLTWVQVHANQGKLGERQFISPGNLEQMHTPQMVISGTPRWKEILPSSYGLGWFIYPYRGYQLVEHGGNIDGFSALVATLPVEKIGIVALTNMDGSSLPTVVAYRALDLLLDLSPVDWNGRLRPEYLEMRAGIEKSKAKSAEARKQGHPPAHPLGDYAGTYHHPGYGDIVIALQDGKLQAVFNNNEFQMDPYNYEVFEFSYEQIDAHVKGTFTTDENGTVTRLSIPLETNVKDIIFERVGDSRLQEKAFLERLVGAYELMGHLLVIALKGEDALTGTLPGQPSFDLIPYQGTTFLIKNLSGASITFKLGEIGPATGIELTQQGIVLNADRKT